MELENPYRGWLKAGLTLALTASLSMPFVSYHQAPRFPGREVVVAGYFQDPLALPPHEHPSESTSPYFHVKPFYTVVSSGSIANPYGTAGLSIEQNQSDDFKVVWFNTI